MKLRLINVKLRRSHVKLRLTNVKLRRTDMKHRLTNARRRVPQGDAFSLRSDVMTTQETTQEQIDVFFSQLPYRCQKNQVASVGD